tara:strand:+ start:14638 stop:14898 length:261 start_codon:yes stop_codon:yes gene_type:complete
MSLECINYDKKPFSMLRPGSMIEIRSVVPAKYKIVVDREYDCPLMSEDVVQSMISRGGGEKRRSKKKSKRSKKTKRYKRSKKSKKR